MHAPRAKPFAKRRRSLAVALAAAVMLLTAAASASAGTIAVAYCKAPSGAPAPTEGWEEGWTSYPLPYAGDNNECGVGGSLTAYLR